MHHHGGHRRDIGKCDAWFANCSKVDETKMNRYFLR
jgi:hypothetical protein